MERMTEILQQLNARLGVEIGSKDETEEERLERLKKHCEWTCELENKEKGNLDEYDGYHCEICNDKGYIVKPQFYINSYNQVQVMCKCTKIRKTIRALKRSGLESVVHDYTFDKYIASEPWQQNILSMAKSYLQEYDNHWFFFGGQSGSGKTHICTAIAIWLLKQGKEVKYMLWRDEASRLKAMVNDDAYVDEITKYKTVDVLYIDDLFKIGRTDMQGKQRPTQADINLAFEILNNRLIQKKITIISSESTITDLIDYDEAMAGRIKQRCGDYCLNIARDRNKNYRLK